MVTTAITLFGFSIAAIDAAPEVNNFNLV